jgi:hypothetical protein
VVYSSAVKQKGRCKNKLVGFLVSFFFFFLKKKF